MFTFLVGYTDQVTIGDLSSGVILSQGCSHLVLEGHRHAEFSSNPDQTHLPVTF